MDFQRAAATTEERFRESIVPRLSDYIRIPNKSPAFDAQWQEHGHMDRAVELIAGWCREQPIAGLQVEIVRCQGPHAADLHARSRRSGDATPCCSTATSTSSRR